MERLPDDIGRYIRLTENITTSLVDDEDLILDSIQIPGPNIDALLLEDLGDVIFRLRSYNEVEQNPDYTRGVEEGLALAANMLEGLLIRHSKPSSS